MDLATRARKVEVRAATMTPKRVQDVYNFGTAASWFGVVFFAVLAAWTLWQFWATLDTEFLLIGASGLAGAALSMMAGEVLHVRAATWEILRAKTETADMDRVRYLQRLRPETSNRDALIPHERV